MKISSTFRILPLAGLLAVAACGGDGPTDPLVDEPISALEDEIVLGVLSDPGAIDAGLELARGPVAMGRRHGMAHGAPAWADGEVERARLRFQEAVQLLALHDTVAARVRAREARRIVAGAVDAAGGGMAVRAMVERAEALGPGVAADPAGFADPLGLEADLRMLGERARVRLQQGDPLDAGDWAVLAEQHHRRRSRAAADGPGGAPVTVELGATAVALAGAILEEEGAVAEQLRFLDEAGELQAAAEDALAAGDEARAVHLAHLASWAALKAVVLPGPVTDEEARLLLELARTTYAAAEATGPEGVEEALLLRAQVLLDAGTAALEEALPRAACLLWRSAVISTWIVG